jgi:hypothetical protein
MTLITLPSPSAGDVDPYAFVDEDYLSAAGKQHILADWQRFITCGFKKLFFTRDLSRFLHHSCDFRAQTHPDTFWASTFNSDVNRLRRFLNQFGGNGYSAESGTRAWLDNPAADLKRAMCQEMTWLYAPLLQVLEDLELKHAELGRVWREVALRQAQDTTLHQVQDATQDAARPGPGLDPGYPPQYLVSENARNLLAYAADIARHQPQPLPGLQRRFPLLSAPAGAGLYIAA